MQRIGDIKKGMSVNVNKLFGHPKEKLPDDVVIVSALRTPLTKAFKGGLKDTAPEEMLAHVLRGVIDDSGINSSLIEDIQVGNVLQPSIGAFNSRMAQMIANIPVKVPISSVNRQCSSGLESCALIAAKIKSGVIDIGIGCGVESMSLFSMKTMFVPEKLSPKVNEVELAKDCTIPMGQTSDIMAHQFKLTRKELDQFSVDSHKKAANAQKNGHFAKEILPIKVNFKSDDKSVKELILKHDDGIREGSTLESMGKLKASFSSDGLSHPGNSSQMTDGAAAVLLMRRSTANKLGMKILAKFVNHVVIGVPPKIMGVGPSEAIPLVLKNTGLEIEDIDIFEINEAFASVVVLAIKKLNLNPKKVNPNGGAIAFGHPLGCTGSRQIATIINELKRTNKNYGIVTMCLGAGMGAAAIIQNE
jgi:acetyl-CoA acyltransferase 1